jgi:hypothetical protein
MSSCRRWNEKPAPEKTWTHFKSHFTAAHSRHNQMKGETAAHTGFQSANAAMTQTEDHMAEATIGALTNMATATATDRGGQCSSRQTTRGNFFRVEGVESFAPSGTSRHAGPKKWQRNCEQLLLEPWLKSGQDSHKPHLHHSQPWPQNGGNLD